MECSSESYRRVNRPSITNGVDIGFFVRAHRLSEVGARRRSEILQDIIQAQKFCLPHRSVTLRHEQYRRKRIFVISKPQEFVAYTGNSLKKSGIVNSTARYTGD